VIRAEPEVGENRTILVQATLTLFWGG